MQLLGAHTSIAGGIELAIQRGELLGCTAIQIFLKQPRKLFDRDIPHSNIIKWRQKRENSKIIKFIIAHTGYLINLASPDEQKWKISVEAMADEMMRADMLQIPYIALHPGSPLHKNSWWGINRVAKAIDILYSDYNFDVNIALELTAGTGSNIGSKFEHIPKIISHSKYPHKLNALLDTCHIYTAGYDFTTPKKYEKMWELFDHIIGMDKLVAIHLNDSRYPLGSHKDRHEHIGKGYLGIEPFKLIMQDDRLYSIPKIIETPKTAGMDKENLKLLWELAGEKPPVPL
ncbi:deoxyribonuclease IV [bacterium]|nr:MAG: deoxyribonuclease IV [bacterium]